MTKIKVNKEKCIKCGNCIKDCITYSLELDNNNYPKLSIDGEFRCNSCQHCFAVCPTGAISFENKTADIAEPISYGSPEEILKLIKSRRSIRQFKNAEISKEDFATLKKMLPYIPTGCNYNGLHFSFVESKTSMDEIRKYVNTKVLKLLSNKITKNYVGKFSKYKEAFEKGKDIIFRRAPHMIIVSSSINAPCANIDPIIALSYIELYAQSLGLGTCWCGLAQRCFKLLPKLSKMVDIPNDYKPVYVMLVGYPDVKYHRTIVPENFPVSEINHIEDFDMDWKQKLKRLALNFIR